MPDTACPIAGHLQQVTPDAASYQLTLVLTNTSGVRLVNAELHFSLAETLEAGEISGAELISRDGDLHRIRLPQLGPDDQLTLRLHSCKRKLRKATDCPYGYFLRTAEGQCHELDIQPGLLNWDLQPVPVSRPDSVQTLIPQPQALTLSEATTFACPTRIVWTPDQAELDDPTAWAQLFRRYAGPELTTTPDSNAAWPLTLEQQPDLPQGGYRLTIEAHGGQLTVADGAGIHAGLSSLVQWLAGHRVQPVVIEDAPRFDYRGLHIDTARHFVPIDELHDLLELCALYRLNRLHWHLTDDEAWRLDIRTYPTLTSIGAWRGPDRAMPPQMGTGAHTHGGFYSQDEVRALVRHAGALGIRVIPEIDLPGHARAMLRALPELQDPADQSRYLSVQSYDDNTLNPGVSATLTILKNILSEVVELFPDAPVHLGSDEVPAGVWTGSPQARARAEELGLAGVEQLHGWLLRELETWLRETHGRTISGWEEIIVDGMVSPLTAVYSWQGVEAGLAAAQQGYQVVLTPAQYCYLDLAWDPGFHEPGYYWAGTTDLAQAYQYEPLAGWEHTDAATRDRLQGLQACLWSELPDRPERRAYMLLPRLLAVAERAWSSAETRNLEDFRQRCLQHRWHWQQAGWHYRTPALGW
ncbi:beta-hexosaminidase [Natronospirillum operosum]|uniref:beta-N-acetylhexosaminidase n=1 Tax=Natronospirillum operosum TaxID=2759953 RepID=A0A4Z0WFK4_9GAMM|nr:beta-N-acetylhexosaminidase [Natronospirillum operosum]TGG94232.1 beta-hexosaminidase [Natronospirillum operosum]